MSHSPAPEGSHRRPSIGLCAVALAAFTSGSISAQEPSPRAEPETAWELAQDEEIRTAIRYQRDFDWDCDWDGQGPDPRRGVSYGGHPSRVQPILLASELSADRTHRARAPYDLFDVFPHLAFDLRNLGGGPIDRVFHRMPWVGDLEVRGQAQPMDPNGDQEMRLRFVSRDEVEPQDDDEDFLRSLDHYIEESIDVEVVLRRRVVPGPRAEGMVVQSFQVALSGRLSRHRPGEDVLRFRVGGRDRWELEAITTPGAELRAAVQEAIESARHYLEGEHLEHGDNTRRGDEGRGNFQGPTLRGLELWALARSGWTIDRPSMKESLDLLLEQPAEQPLTIAMRILAVDALYDRQGIGRARPIVIDTGTPRQRAARRDRLPTEIGVQMDRWARELLGFADPEQLERGRFVLRFASDGFESTQVNWVGLQALDAAEAHGFELPDELWSEAATWLCEQAIPVGPSVTFEVGFGPKAFLGDSDRVRTRTATPLAYSRHASTDPYATQGAATLECAAALALCRQRLRRADRDLQRRCDEVLEGIVAWMAMTLTPRVDVSIHPIYYQDVPDLRLAMPFALEGLGVESLGLEGRSAEGFRTRDWYFDAVNVTLTDQGRDGGFAATVIGTPAALMILRPRVDGALTGERDR